jgi:hypothetical protein
MFSNLSVECHSKMGISHVHIIDKVDAPETATKEEKDVFDFLDDMDVNKINVKEFSKKIEMELCSKSPDLIKLMQKGIGLSPTKISENRLSFDSQPT